MDERENVEVLFLGNITHENQQQHQSSEKSNYQDEISFADPVQIELIRIPSNGKQMYSRLTSLTQKQPIKSLEIYYRNLDKKVAARYSLLVCSSSELLVSSSIDILMTLPETIFTDLLVIRGNFTNITFCIYGRVLRSKQEIQKKCPYFINNIEVPLREDQPSIKIHRNVFDQSRTIVKAIEDEYSQQKEETKYYNWEAYSNDRQLYDSQITNICKLSQQLSNYDDHDHIQQRSIAQIRSKMQSMLSYLSKLFKSAHIGLYYPTPYRPSAIPEVIPTSIVKLSIKLLTQSLSDQYRTLQVLKLILQLGPHAQYFVKLNGINALIRLFLQFFSSDLIILSSLKSLVLQIFIVLSFWDFAANKLVDKFQFSLSENSKKSNLQADKESEDEQESSLKEKSRQKSSRSRQKKKKKNNPSPSKSSQKDRKKSKKEKKSKKNKERQRQKSRQKQKQKDKKRDKNKQISQQRLKDKKQSQKQKQKQKFPIKKQQKMQPQQKVQPAQFNIKQKIQQCNSFYEVIFVLMRYEKNCKLQQLMRIFILQITQTLTRNIQVSNQMAYYTPLLRDTKYMFNQGGQMINSKTLKTFASFQPFLNSQQSTNVKSLYVCQRQKINNPKVYGISPKLFKLIDSAISIFQSKSEDQTTIIYDQQFMTLVSALIQNNKSGIAIGLGYFIQAIKIDTLLGLKKQEAVVAIICQYIHEVLIQDEGMNLIYYLDQIHNSMLKIINWLKQDRTFSLQIKRKVQYLINSALIYNHFSGTENNFKSFSEYFIKLIGHENFDIHKILDYSRKEYHKTVNPLAYANLAENFSLGNFHDVLPAQPLLEVDICLRMFLAILKLNKNIWTVFYQYKFVPAFATLYLKIHSLLKFFLTPSLQRQNALIDIKIFERLINNYIQVAIHLTSIFIHKWRYESAFNQLTEQQDIFDTVQLYQKLLDTYITLYNSLHIQDSMLIQQRTRTRIKELFTNFVQLFDVIFKGYELTKHPDRMRNLRSIIKYLYRLHYEGVAARAGVIGLLRLFVGVAGPATYEAIAAYLFDKNPKNTKDTYDVLLPNNQKSIFQNIFRRNIYRSDIQIVQTLSSLLQSLLIQQQHPESKNYSSSTVSSFISAGGSNLGHMGTSSGPSSNTNSNIVNNTKEKIYQLIENILDENQAQQKQYLEEHHDAEESLKFIMEKNTMFANFLAYVKAPMNNKIQQHMLRLLKHSLTIKNPPSLSIGSTKSQSPHIRTLKLRNSYLNFFVSVFKYNKQLTNQFFYQFIKISSNLMQSQVLTRNSQQDQDSDLKMQQLKGVLLALQCLIEGSSNVAFQSVMLFGEYIEKPTRPACEISLEKIFAHFKNIKSIERMSDEKEEAYIKQIGICAFYLLCRLTTIDGVQFYSTECRKNALNMLVSPQKLFNLHQITQSMQQFVPKALIQTIKNYLDFPIIQKPQSISNSAPTASSNKSACKYPSIAYLYSKGVFTMISENEPVGRARFQLIQERWQGGDTEAEIFKVNTPLDYPAIVNDWIFNRDLAIQCGIADNKLLIQYTGIHEPKQVNSLFHFKIRKIFTQDPKKNSQSINKTILMKNIPNQIKRPEPTTKQAYMNKLNTSPSLNRSSGSMTSLPVGGTSGSNTNIPPPNSMGAGQNNMVNRSGYPPINPQPLNNPGVGSIPVNMGNNPNPSMNTNINPNMNMNRSSSNNREPSPYNMTKPPYVPPNKMNYTNSAQSYNMPINPNTPGAMNPVNPVNAVMPNPPYYPQKNPVPYTQPIPKAMPVTKPYNAGYDHPSNPMMQPPMYDPRVYYPPTTYDPRNPSSYHPGGYMVPQQTNYPQRPIQPAMSYPSPSLYPQGYQPQPTHPAHVQPGPKKVEQQMASQAIRILIYLQQNPNVPDKEQLKGKVNKLFQAPGVHERVTRYFEDLKRN